MCFPSTFRVRCVSPVSYFFAVLECACFLHWWRWYSLSYYFFSFLFFSPCPILYFCLYSFSPLIFSFYLPLPVTLLFSALLWACAGIASRSHGVCKEQHDGGKAFFRCIFPYFVFLPYCLCDLSVFFFFTVLWFSSKDVLQFVQSGLVSLSFF